jgi:hypothetical protein
VENALPSGFFRDALRTYAGRLSFLEYLALPASLHRVISDVDGRGTDLSVFLFSADLRVLRDCGCLILVLPLLRAWPSEGHRLDTMRRGDRLSLPPPVDGAANCCTCAVLPPKKPPPPHLDVMLGLFFSNQCTNDLFCPRWLS